MTPQTVEQWRASYAAMERCYHDGAPIDFDRSRIAFLKARRAVLRPTAPQPVRSGPTVIPLPARKLQ